MMNHVVHIKRVIQLDAIPMNHVIHHIETPPGLTPPRLLAGGREGKVLYVESQYYVIHEPRDSRY